MGESGIAARAFAFEPDAARAVKLRAACLLCGVSLSVTGSPADLAPMGEHASFGLISCIERSPDALDMVSQLRRDQPRLPLAAILGSDADPSWRDTVLRSGVWDFLCFPCSVEELRLRVRSLIRQSTPEKTQQAESPGYEEEIRRAIGEILLRERETLHVLGKAAEFKDQETGAHVVRVARYSVLIARMIGVDRLAQDTLFHSSALHDVGKIGIPDSILLKPGRLSAPEYDTMKTHTTRGHGILVDTGSSYLLTGAMIALTHHEHYDGTGYPMGIAGEEIPLFGRIVCVADVFDALTTRRPYKEPWPLERAFGLLKTERGRQFDPTLVDAFQANQLAAEYIFRTNDGPVRAIAKGPGV